MALRPEFSLGHSEFNDFLFATIGEEKSGSELTVLTALTRLGFDPWREAARLSNLPMETASRVLAATIASLPEGNWMASDSGSIAQRLVNILPKRRPPVSAIPNGRPAWQEMIKSGKAIWWIAALIAVLLFGLSLL